jgi:hypothetical protein
MASGYKYFGDLRFTLADSSDSKREIEEAAEYHRKKGYKARVVKDSEIGWCVYIHG